MVRLVAKVDIIAQFQCAKTSETMRKIHFPISKYLKVVGQFVLYKSNSSLLLPLFTNPPYLHCCWYPPRLQQDVLLVPNCPFTPSSSPFIHKRWEESSAWCFMKISPRDRAGQIDQGGGWTSANVPNNTTPERQPISGLRAINYHTEESAHLRPVIQHNNVYRLSSPVAIDAWWFILEPKL